MQLNGSNDGVVDVGSHFSRLREIEQRGEKARGFDAFFHAFSRVVSNGCR
ncbi:Uncharacterised protein [Vibrio cholerae]|nr:Uncharacterised protein [Vibrio cholerae]